MEINKKLACTLPKSKNRVAEQESSGRKVHKRSECTCGHEILHFGNVVQEVSIYLEHKVPCRYVCNATLPMNVCSRVQVIERRALAYIRVASKEFILSILVRVYVSTTFYALKCFLLFAEHEKVFLARICMYYTAP